MSFMGGLGEGASMTVELKAIIGDFVEKMGQAKETFVQTTASMEAQAAQHQAAIGKGLQEGGAVGLGAAALLIKAHDAESGSMNQLRKAYEDAGLSFEEYAKKVEHLDNVGREKAFTDQTTNDALRAYIERGGDASKATDKLAMAMDIARGRGMTLSSVMEKMALLEGGNAKAAKALGLTTDEISKSSHVAEGAFAGEATALEKQITQLKLSTAETIAAGGGQKAHAAATSHTETVMVGHGKTLHEVTKTVKDHAAAVVDSTKATKDELKVAEAKLAALKLEHPELQKVQKATIDAAEAEGILANRNAGQANASVSTLTGHLKVLAVQAEHVFAKIGVIGPALGIVSGFATVAGTVMQFLAARKLAAAKAAEVLAAGEGKQAAATQLAAAAGGEEAVAAGASVAPIAAAGLAADTAAGGFLAMAAGVWAAMAPFIPIIAGLALVGVAVYLLWDNWSAVWGFIKDLTGSVVGFVKDHLDIFIAAVTGPIAPLLLLWHHWDEVWGWIKGAISDAWNTIKDIGDWIIGKIHDVIDAVDHLVSKIPGGGAIMGGLSSLFATGGTVPGPTGMPQLAIVHGGEQITRPGGDPGGDSGGGLTVHVHVAGSVLVQRDIETAVQTAVMSLQRRGATIGIAS